MRWRLKLVKWLLKTDLNEDEMNYVATLALDNLFALPIRDIITLNDSGTLLVNGRPLTPEVAITLRESARACLQSIARRIIHEQVLYQAVVSGVHKVENNRQMFFSRAAILYAQEEDKLLKLLAGEDDGERGNSPLSEI